MKRILVMEDEDAIREFVVINLQRAGYDVVEANSGEAALQRYEENHGEFDVAILDIMMPGIDGLTVCKELRKKSGNLGIIMLTAKTQEMVARVDSLYRRVAIAEMREENNFQEELVSGDFVLNLRNRALKKKGRMIELTQVEFQIMEYFFSNPGVALDRTNILTHVWGEAYYGEEKIVDVNIRRLRMKIEDEPSNPRHIVTVWGLGYKWEA